MPTPRSIVLVSIIFLISSAVAVLPFTLGGISARELVFLYGSNLLVIEMSSAVAVSLIFFVITAVTSPAGIYYALVPPDFELKTASEKFEFLKSKPITTRSFGLIILIASFGLFSAGVLLCGQF